MINKITKEQELKIQEYYDEGMSIGLDTKTDKRKAEKGINGIYRFCGYKKPKFIWCQSPMQMNLMINLLKNTNLFDQLWDQLGDQLGGQLRGQLRGQLVGQLWDQLRGQLGDQLGGQLVGQLWGQLGGQLRGQLGGQLGGQLMDQLGGQLRDQLWDQLGDQLRGQLWGQLRGQLNIYIFSYGYAQNEIYWIQFYRYIHEILNIQIIKKIKIGLYHMLRISKYSGWWYPFENYVFICEKPTTINYDTKNKRMHSIEKSIIEFSDGYKMYCLNNIRIPIWVFETEKEKIDYKKIIAIDNVEQKKEIIQFLGEDWFFSKINAKCLDKRILYLDAQKKVYKRQILNSMKIEYQLLSAEIGLSEPIKLLCMENASNDGVKHYETVGPHCKTILDAFESRTGIREFPIYLS